MPNLDFGRELLQRVPERVGMIALEDVLWSDWERPDRILDTLNVLGKDPAFPPEIATKNCYSSTSLASNEVMI
jgi:hypothetical protein